VARTSLLLFGASGFLGPHLVRAARARGWRVVAASRATAESLCAPDHAPDEHWPFDAASPTDLAPLFDAVRPGAVCVAAALARVEECERDPTRASALNAELPAALARLAHERGLRLVHLSTDLVFGARPPRAERYDEEDPPSPMHVYGRTKAEGEARVLAAAPEALVARLPLLYGESFGRGLGAGDALLAALERGERPTLFDDEWRTPLEAGNAAEAVLELLGGADRGRLHLAGPARLNRAELGRILLQACERGALIERVRVAPRAALGLEALRPRDVSLDARRARAVLKTPLLAPEEALHAARARAS
jgi:dTDP-4-dehydrorhamnose reductase